MHDRCVKPLKIGSSNSVRFSPDSHFLATIARNVVLWNVESRERVAHAHPFTHPAWMDFSPSGDRIAVKNTAGHICILSIPDLALVVTFDKRGASEGNQISFSPCGRYLIDSDWDGRVAVRDAANGAFVRQEVFPDTMIRWFAARSDRCAFAFGPYPKIESDSAPPTGLVACRTWPFTDESTATFDLDNGEVDCVALSSDGRRVAALINEFPDHRLELLEQCSTGWTSRHTTVTHKGGTSLAMAWSPDDSRLALTEGPCISVFEAATLTRVAQHEIPYPCDVAWSSDGRLLALGSWSKGIVIDAKSVGNLVTGSNHQDPVRQPSAELGLDKLKMLIQKAKARR